MSTNNFPGVGYKTQGFNFNFFQKVIITATTFGGGSVSNQQPDLVIPFSTHSVILLNENVSGVVEYSFNGITTDGELDPTLPSKGFVFDNRIISLIWFRVKVGSSGPITVSVQAWGN